MVESTLRDREAPFQSARLSVPPIEGEFGEDYGTKMWIFDGDVSELETLQGSREELSFLLNLLRA